jgi:hypothetical protein
MWIVVANVNGPWSDGTQPQQRVRRTTGTKALEYYPGLEGDDDPDN